MIYGCTEVAIFYCFGLFVFCNYRPLKLFEKQRAAGKIYTGFIFRRTYHPGIATYIIHSYDFRIG